MFAIESQIPVGWRKGCKPLSKSDKVETVEEIGLAIEKLTKAEWAKLHSFARNRARVSLWAKLRPLTVAVSLIEDRIPAASRAGQ